MQHKLLQRFLPAETYTQTDMNAFGSIRLLKNHSSKRREMQNSLHDASFRQSMHVFKCCSWSSLSIGRLQANPQAEGNPQSQQAAYTDWGNSCVCRSNVLSQLSSCSPWPLQDSVLFCHRRGRSATRFPTQQVAHAFPTGRWNTMIRISSGNCNKLLAWAFMSLMYLNYYSKISIKVTKSHPQFKERRINCYGQDQSGAKAEQTSSQAEWRQPHSNPTAQPHLLTPAGPKCLGLLIIRLSENWISSVRLPMKRLL